MPNRSAAIIDTTDTKLRLLEAAGEVFAENGFENATVRDICDRAGANIAAINYHFQGKERLYAAVLRHCYTAALDKFPPTLGLASEATPRQRLHAFVRAVLLRVFDEGRPTWYGKLVSREMLEPTAALDEMVELAIRPQQQIILAIIRSIVPGISDMHARMCMFSVVGQCLFYHHCRSVVERTTTAPPYSADGIENLAEHITTFSFGALQALAAQKARP